MEPAEIEVGLMAFRAPSTSHRLALHNSNDCKHNGGRKLKRATDVIIQSFCFDPFQRKVVEVMLCTVGKSLSSSEHGIRLEVCRPNLGGGG